MPPKPPTPKLTHFLCIPLITPTSLPQLQKSLTTFRQTATHATHTPQIPGAAIRPLGTLHLTVGVMSLLTPERVASALAVLRGLDLRGMVLEALVLGKSEKEEKSGEKKEGGSQGGEERESSGESSGSRGLKITLQGLKSMHDPTSTSTLYAPPVDSPALLSFCQQLKDAFTDAGLLVPDARPLLLHATVLNTIYVPRGGRGKGGGGHGGKKGRITIDAEEMLEDWADFVWMEGVRVENVAVCRMGAKKGVDGEEAYEVEGSVDMP